MELIFINSMASLMEALAVMVIGSETMHSWIFISPSQFPIEEAGNKSDRMPQIVNFQSYMRFFR